MNQGENSRVKRKRLNFACNYCRSRKTRCDERQPSCTTCLLAGMECITTDKRRPGVRIENRRRTIPTLSSGETPSPQSLVPNLSPESQVQLPSTEGTGPRVATNATPTEGPHLSPRSNLYNESGLSEYASDKQNVSSWRGPCSPYCPQSHTRTPPTTKERYTGRLPMMPRFMGTSTLQLIANWLDLAFCRLGVHESSFSTKASANLKNSLAPLALTNPLESPKLPSYGEATDCLSRYTMHVHPIFPILVVDVLELTHSTIFSGIDSPKSLLSLQEVPVQALYYVAIAFGITAQGKSSDAGTRINSFIAYCNTLLGHMIGHRSIRSVQAIFLLSLLLREHDRISESCDVLKVAISMAQSMGADHEQSASGRELRQTWWCIFVLEKMLVFDTGQSSTIHYCGLEPEISKCEDALSDDDLYFDSILGFAKLLYEINGQSFRAWNREESLRQPPEESIREKLQTAGRLVMLVSDWYKKLLNCGLLLSTTTSTPTNIPRKAFLTSQYYYMVVILHRTTLLIDQSDLYRAIDKYCSEQPWHDLIRSAPRICVEAARDIVKLLVFLDEISSITSYIAINAPLSAVSVLSIRIIGDPTMKMNRSDFELLKIGMTFAEKRYHNTDGKLALICSYLESYLLTCLESEERRQKPQEETTLIEQASLPTNWLFSTDGLQPQMLSNIGPQAIDWAGWDLGELDDIFNEGE